ncbi:hypothetical protein OS493_039182, partial [Desmophyllum pertusum]
EKDFSQESEVYDAKQNSQDEDAEEMMYRAQRGELSVDFLICCFFWCSCCMVGVKRVQSTWLQDIGLLTDHYSLYFR